MNARLFSALAAAAALVPSSARAGSFEIGGHFGAAFPFYSQTFTYGPGSTTLKLPGFPTVTLDQQGSFELKGKGGSTFGASATFYPSSVFGIEARIDSARIEIETKSAVYRVSADLPAPVPDFATNVALPQGTVDVDRLHPISLNLKVKSSGTVGFALSGGVSYLPTVHATAEQPIGLGASSFNPLTSSVAVSRIGLRAETAPDNGDSTNRIGGNLGVGLRVRLGGPVTLTAEGRVFAFPKHDLEWEPVLPGVLSAFEQELLRRIEGEIDPIEFNPTFFQATAGIAVAF